MFLGICKNLQKFQEYQRFFLHKSVGKFSGNYYKNETRIIQFPPIPAAQMSTFITTSSKKKSDISAISRSFSFNQKPKFVIVVNVRNALKNKLKWIYIIF
jgi:hypothetical protein